jgi:hypothetical protein
MAATLQRIVISLLVVLTFTFVYFAQVAEAAGKGPRITHKVCCTVCSIGTMKLIAILLGLLRHRTWRGKDGSRSHRSLWQDRPKNG